MGAHRLRKQAKYASISGTNITRSMVEVGAHLGLERTGTTGKTVTIQERFDLNRQKIEKYSYLDYSRHFSSMLDKQQVTVVGRLFSDTSELTSSSGTFTSIKVSVVKFGYISCGYILDLLHYDQVTNRTLLPEKERLSVNVSEYFLTTSSSHRRNRITPSSYYELNATMTQVFGYKRF